MPAQETIPHTELLDHHSDPLERHNAALRHEAPVEMLPTIPKSLGPLGDQLMKERRERSRASAEATHTIVEQHEAIERSLIDPVTNLRNRRAFDQEFTGLFNRMPSGSLGLMLVDLNGLNRANNKMGHDAGDEYLQKAAAAITHSIRPTDRAYRVGGDELAVVIDGQNVKGIGLLHVMSLIAGRMKHATEHQLGDAAERLYLGLSIGAAVNDSEHRTKESLIKSADDAQIADKERFYDRVEAETGVNLRR